MRTPSLRGGRSASAALAAAAALAAVTTATALAAPSHNLPAAGNKLTTCHTTLFKVGGRLPVHTALPPRRGGITYTMGRDATGSLGGMPTSGPIYGWSGAGVVIYLLNPTD